MKRLIVLMSIYLAMSLLITGCSVMPNQETAILPPLNKVILVSENNDNALIMVMRQFDNPITEVEINKIRADVKTLWQGKEIQTDTPKISSTPQDTDTNRLVVYGYAIDADGIPFEYFGSVVNARSVSPSYRKGEDWLISQINNAEYKMVSQ